jgi:pimeloyl-ACP methyl ester carboxylesterase
VSTSVLNHRIDGAENVGAPILLLNGVAMTIASWQPVANRLIPHRRILRCDLRGQLTSPGEPPSTIAGHTRYVLNLLDVVGYQHVHILATSFGATVAAELASQHPERVLSLALVAVADGFDRELAYEIDRWRGACLDSLAGPDRGYLMDVLDPVVYSRTYLDKHPEERKTRRRQVAAMPDSWFEGLVALLDSASGASIREALPGITAPTLVVAAELDGFVSVERARNLAEAIRDARFVIMPGAGHAVVVEQPVELAYLYTEFLDEVET